MNEHLFFGDCYVLVEAGGVVSVLLLELTPCFFRSISCAFAPKHVAYINYATY